MKALVTGAEGSVGTALVPTLREQGWTVIATDIDTMNVTKPAVVRRAIAESRPDVIFHLAAYKHAPAAETMPAGVAIVNVLGTENVTSIGSRYGAKIVLASTCKAADPETVYGASKLIAERIVLNAGGVVVRYFNARDTGGNVFRLWEQVSPDEPIEWTDCWRYFISLEQAVTLTIRAASFPSGRYSLDPGPARHMKTEARDLYPERVLRKIPRRRGDRYREPLMAQSERCEPRDGYLTIYSPHDAP